MRLTTILIAAALVATPAVPAFAQSTKDTMGTMGMMAGGEVMTFMGDGHMGKTMVTDKAMIDKMMKNAKPIKGCMMIVTGADGKTYIADTSTAAAKKQCESMAM